MRRFISFFMSIAMLFCVLATPVQAVIVTSTALLYGGAAVVALALGVLGLRQTGTDQALADYCQEIFDSDAVQMAAGILGFSAAYASGWLPILMQRDVQTVSNPDGTVSENTVTKTYIPEQVLTAVANEAISSGAYLPKGGSGVKPPVAVGYSPVPSAEQVPNLAGTDYTESQFLEYQNAAMGTTLSFYEVYFHNLGEYYKENANSINGKLISQHIDGLMQQVKLQAAEYGITQDEPISLTYDFTFLSNYTEIRMDWSIRRLSQVQTVLGLAQYDDSMSRNVDLYYGGYHLRFTENKYMPDAIVGQKLSNGVYSWYVDGERLPIYFMGMTMRPSTESELIRGRAQYIDGAYSYAFRYNSTWSSSKAQCVIFEPSADISTFYTRSYALSINYRTSVFGVEGGTANPSIDIPIDVQIGVTTENPIGDDVINSLDELVGKIDGWSDYLDKGVSIPLEGTGAATGATTVDETLGLEIDIPIDATGSVPGVIDKPQDITGAQDGTVSDVTDLVDSSANVAENQDVVEQFVDWMEGYIALDTSIFRKFPLSIIYDVYAFFSVVATGSAPGVSGVMDATPGTLPSVSGGTTAQQPVIEIPIKYGDFFDTELSIDLTDYEQTIAFIRTTEGAVFMLALIWYELNRRKE